MRFLRSSAIASPLDAEAGLERRRSRLAPLFIADDEVPALDGRVSSLADPLAPTPLPPGVGTTIVLLRNCELLILICVGLGAGRKTFLPLPGEDGKLYLFLAAVVTAQSAYHLVFPPRDNEVNSFPVQSKHLRLFYSHPDFAVVCTNPAAVAYTQMTVTETVWQTRPAQVQCPLQ